MSICGLDFGTSNSTVGIAIDGKPTMVPLEKNLITGQMECTLPSAIFFDFETDEVHFGRDGINRYAKGEFGRLMRSMKNVLGTPLMDETTQVKFDKLSFAELISFFVASLKQRAVDFGGRELESVVMGRPVRFNDDDAALDLQAQNRLEEIAKLSGFKNVSFQYEPIAAAYDYEQQVQGEEVALIIDMGGGTSDFTIIRLGQQHARQADRKSDLLANHGIHIGGTNFDRNLSLATVMPHFGLGAKYKGRPGMKMPTHYFHSLSTWHEIHHLYDPAVLRKLKDLRFDIEDKTAVDRLLTLLQQRDGHRLAGLVEQCKIELSNKPEAIIDLDFLNREEDLYDHVEYTASQATLHNAVINDMQRVISAIDETLVQSGIGIEQINTVFTTGGSTALPTVKQLVQQKFPQCKIVNGDLFNSVGKGLYLEAVRRY